MRLKIRILRIALATCVLAAAVGMAGCLPGEPWEVQLNGWWETTEPFTGYDNAGHAPSPGNVWRYVDLTVTQHARVVTGLDRDDIALVVGTESYEPTERLQYDAALPEVFFKGLPRTGLLAFDVPDGTDGGKVVMYPSDGAVLAVVLGEETRID